MTQTYLPILLLLVVAAAIGVGLLTASFVLGRIGRSKTDLQPYECGLDPMDEPFKRMSVRYYLVALLFLLFDVETLFLFPIAAVFRGRPKDVVLLSGTVPMPENVWLFFVWGEMVLFLVILLVGYVYILKKGALKWQ